MFEVDDYLYFYRESLTDERSDEEVHALVSLLELDQPVKLLDLACGFGRHANRLAALGHKVIGVDLTPGFLELARRDAAARKVPASYQQGDMRKIDFDNQFDRALLVFTAFGYFEDDQNLLVLQNAQRALKPGGLLIFDIHNRDVFLKDFKPFFVMEKEGNLMIDRTTFDSLSGRMVNHRIVIRNGLRKDKPFFVRLYNPNEIRDLLKQAGLEVYHMYGGWDARPVSTELRRMVIIARKPYSMDGVNS